MKKVLIICLTALIVYACKHQIILDIVVPTNLVYTPTSVAALKGIAGNSVVPTIDNGGGVINYTITSGAVSGISINSGTGVITWSSTVAVGNYDISVTASNSVGTTATTFRFVVHIAATAPANLSYTPSGSTIVAGTAGNSVAPNVNTGGSTITFSLTGTVPAGITINSSTGVISWANTVAVGNYNITVAATNNLGNTTTAYPLTVQNTITVIAPASFAYSPASSNVSQGVAGASATPSINNGLGTIAYSFVSSVPSGVTVNSSTGIINWSSSVALGTYNFTLAASNTAGNTTTNYALTVTAAAANGAVCFSSEILPLYQTYCAQTGCHNSISQKEGVVTDSYANIMKGIKAKNPNSSKYYTEITNGKMPPSGSAQMSATQIAVIQKWINEGAANTICASACDPTQFTYATSISALLANNCVGCHNATVNYGTVILSDYASAKAAGVNLKTNFLSAINYTAAVASRNMPPSGKLSTCQVTQLTNWINNGCPQ